MKYNKGSFITVPNKQVLKGKDSVLQCVYMRVCSFADEDGICYPSYQTIADHAGCSKSTVKVKIKVLLELGLLQKTSRFKDNEQQSNLYQLLLQGGSRNNPHGSTADLGGGSTGNPHGSTADLGGGSTADHRTKSTLLTKSNNSSTQENHPCYVEQLATSEDEKIQVPLFVNHWTETFQRGKNKGKEKREGEATRDLKKRFAKRMRNVETNFGRNIPKEPQTEQEWIALLNKIGIKAFTDKYGVAKHRETKLASL